MNDDGSNEGFETRTICILIWRYKRSRMYARIWFCQTGHVYGIISDDIEIPFIGDDLRFRRRPTDSQELDGKIILPKKCKTRRFQGFVKVYHRPSKVYEHPPKYIYIYICLAPPRLFSKIAAKHSTAKPILRGVKVIGL